MARTRTLTNLISDVRVEGDYNRSAVFTDTMLTRWINQAIAQVYNLIVSVAPDYYVTETALTTVADQEYVNLPADFYKLRRLDILVSTGNYARLFSYSLEHEDDFYEPLLDTGYTSTYRYSLQANKLKLKPTPKAVDTLRMVYVPCVTDLSLGSDTFDGINGWEDLVVQLVLLRCDKREEKPTSEREAEIARLKGEIRAWAGGRDATEPYLLPDHSGGWG